MLQLQLIFFLPFPRNVDLFHFIVKKFERVNQQWQVLYRNKMQQIMSTKFLRYCEETYRHCRALVYTKLNCFFWNHTGNQKGRHHVCKNSSTINIVSLGRVQTYFKYFYLFINDLQWKLLFVFKFRSSSQTT